MSHKILRNREHHKALEARFTPTVPLFPSDSNTPASSPTQGSDPNPDGIGDILTIPNLPGTPNQPSPNQPSPNQPSPNQPPNQLPPVFQTTTSSNIATIVRSNTLVTPIASPSTTPLATLSTSTTPLTILSTPSSTAVVQTTPSTSLTPTSTRQVETESTVFTTITPSSTFSGSSVPAVTPSQTPTSSGLGTGPIVGLAAAGVAGIAVLGVAGIWLFKKYVSHKDEPIDGENFTRHSWMRNSVALNDDHPDDAGAGVAAGVNATAAASQYSPGARPRPPTMIERHQANFSAMRGYTPGPNQQQGLTYNDNMAGYGYGGYEAPGGYDSPYGAATAPPVPPMPVMRNVSPGQTYPVQDINPQPYHNPIASPPPLGHSPAPSNGSNAYATAPVPYFTRHTAPNSPPPAGSLPNPYIEESNPGYANMERSASITPFQQQTYNEISQQLERSPFADPGISSIPAPPLSPVRSGTPQVVNVPDVHTGQETPVQFGYNDNQPAQAATASRPKRSGSLASKKSAVGRPETVYDEEDAYGGI